MSIEERIKFFSEQISCEGNLYTWIYNHEGNLLESNCPQELLLGTAFSLFGCEKEALSYGIEHDEPLIPGTSFGLAWVVAYEKTPLFKRMYVIGPVFATDISHLGVDKALKHYNKLDISLSWMHDFKNVLKTLPVIPSVVLTRYAAMLHYCVTGEKMGAKENITQSDKFLLAELAIIPERDRHKVWEAEQVILRMVRDGDLNYKQAKISAQMISNGVPTHSREPLRQAKNSIIVFISLCTRAAIEGGLSPDLAYTLGDTYIQKVEDATTASDLNPISDVMYTDFVYRVRKCRINPKVSRHIQNCLNYIEMHVEEKIKLKTLAQYVGYTEYYLSRKFKAEVGCTVIDYIKFAKVERAKLLLVTTEETIQEISERLGYCSRSYFGEVFSQITGLSPVEYRDKNKKI